MTTIALWTPSGQLLSCILPRFSRILLLFAWDRIIWGGGGGKQQFHRKSNRSIAFSLNIPKHMPEYSQAFSRIMPHFCQPPTSIIIRTSLIVKKRREVKKWSADKIIRFLDIYRKYEGLWDTYVTKESNFSWKSRFEICGYR